MEKETTRFATPEDHRLCRELHRRHGTTYYFATTRLPNPYRDRVHALYGFVRLPDEWVDNPSRPDVRGDLCEFREQLRQGLAGKRPDEPVLRAFCDVARQSQMGLDEPECFLDAMETDLERARYGTYEELRGYMRGSACAVGLMMLTLLGCDVDDPRLSEPACALGEAMQLTNFLRDVAEDARRGRIYLPQDELARFGVREDDVLEARMTPEFAALAKFQMERARSLYAESDAGLPLLPPEARKGVTLARVLYARILDRIEAQGCDVFRARARTSRTEKLHVAARVLAGLTV